ncbi:MAG: hypothetical protein LBT83_02160 [Tannerella sp.]|jgi:hypothetical protein|nr:hypothetical protein [Tannerella sp.]
MTANPIHDTVFKRLMENERVARFFIGTLPVQTIVSLEMNPQEFRDEKDRWRSCSSGYPESDPVIIHNCFSCLFCDFDNKTPPFGKKNREIFCALKNNSIFVAITD